MRLVKVLDNALAMWTMEVSDAAVRDCISVHVLLSYSQIERKLLLDVIIGCRQGSHSYRAERGTKPATRFSDLLSDLEMSYRCSVAGFVVYVCTANRCSRRQDESEEPRYHSQLQQQPLSRPARSKTELFFRTDSDDIGTLEELVS